ncbi:MAG: SMC-Scp complex subunit ScpB [Candidatus Zapsychrus exili]|nr:SMC-Scp complex subunit ScpB [Candidatus Zapsychrus exili]
MENQTIDNTAANTDQQQSNYVRGAIEALMFVNEKSITLDQFKKVIKTVTPSEIKKTIKVLQDEYEQKNAGMTIVEIAGGYQMLSNSSYASYIKDFYKTKHKEKLSKPALEALAIISYKQPVTRSDIENIRSVNSDGVVVNLLDKELIKIVGRKDVPGKPYLYGTTRQFLEYFGLKSLEDLPKLEEFSDLLPEEEKDLTNIEEPKDEESRIEEIEKATEQTEEKQAEESDVIENVEENNEEEKE